MNFKNRIRVYTIIDLGIHHNSNFELWHTPKLIWVYTINNLGIDPN